MTTPPAPASPSGNPELRVRPATGELDLARVQAAARQKRRIAAQRRAAGIIAAIPPPRPPIG